MLSKSNWIDCRLLMRNNKLDSIKIKKVVKKSHFVSCEIEKYKRRKRTVAVSVPTRYTPQTTHEVLHFCAQKQNK
jgi:hypothetical protein